MFGPGLTLVPVFDEPITLPDGRRYQRFVGEGRFFHKFNLGAFPLDHQQLILELEDTQRGEDELVLEADPSSSVAPALTIPGWRVGAPVLEVRHVDEGALGLDALEVALPARLRGRLRGDRRPPRDLKADEVSICEKSIVV